MWRLACRQMCGHTGGAASQKAVFVPSLGQSLLSIFLLSKAVGSLSSSEGPGVLYLLIYCGVGKEEGIESLGSA